MISIATNRSIGLSKCLRRATVPLPSDPYMKDRCLRWSCRRICTKVSARAPTEKMPQGDHSNSLSDCTRNSGVVDRPERLRCMHLFVRLTTDLVITALSGADDFRPNYLYCYFKYIFCHHVRSASGCHPGWHPNKHLPSV